MSNNLTEDTKTIILLCGVFGGDKKEKPLSGAEYSAIVRYLMENKMRPSDLLQKDIISCVSAASGIGQRRLEALLGRGMQLGFSLEEWQRNGIWIISRSDADYPMRYKKHLKDKAPPLLFGSGDRSLLNQGGMSIVGSRNVDQTAIDFTSKVAKICVRNHMPIISGGAKGIDQIAMSTAIECGGCAIGVLAENLLKKSLRLSAREAIADGRLVLISPYHPNAPFTVGTAMGRNKLIYALSDFGLVVSSDYNKGGTWAGAVEELKRENALPVFVRIDESTPGGNEKLLKMGAIPWEPPIHQDNLIQELNHNVNFYRIKKSNIRLDMFNSSPGENSNFVETKEVVDIKSTPSVSFLRDDDDVKNDLQMSIYQAVLPIILDFMDKAVTAQELATNLDVNLSQLNRWLKKAQEDKKILRLTKPLRYQKAVKTRELPLL